MKTPAGLQPLIDDGVIDEVIRSLKSGKEATVYLVRSGAHMRCAKVYRDMAQRSFQKRARYQEGRKVRGSRQARAMSKRTRFGRKEQEAAWKNAEVDALYKLVAAGVRVPKPYGYFNDTLIMELVTDAAGDPAPRLGEVDLSPGTAREYHRYLVQQVVRMLSIGLIHGDLSEFNVDEPDAQHAHDLLDEVAVILARSSGRKIDFAKARGRVPGGIGHQLHDQRVVEVTVRLRHAHAGGDELVQCIDFGVLPGSFLLLAPETRSLAHGARLAAAVHLAAFLVPGTLLEASLRHVAVDLRAPHVRPRAHEINRRLLASLERADDFVAHAIVDLAW